MWGQVRTNQSAIKSDNGMHAAGSLMATSCAPPLTNHDTQPGILADRILALSLDNTSRKPGTTTVLAGHTLGLYAWLVMARQTSKADAILLEYIRPIPMD